MFRALNRQEISLRRGSTLPRLPVQSAGARIQSWRDKLELRHVVAILALSVAMLSAPSVAELCTIDAVPAARSIAEADHGDEAELFADGFESGDLSAWRSREQVAGSLVVNEDAAMYRRSAQGLEVVANGNAWVQAKTPNDEKVFALGFLLDPHTLRLRDGKRITLLQLRPGQGRSLLDLQIQSRGGNLTVRLRTRGADGRFTILGRGTVTRGQTNLIEVARLAATAGNSDGVPRCASRRCA